MSEDRWFVRIWLDGMESALPDLVFLTAEGACRVRDDILSAMLTKKIPGQGWCDDVGNELSFRINGLKAVCLGSGRPT